MQNKITRPFVPTQTVKLLSNHRSHPLPWSKTEPNLSNFSGWLMSNSNGSSSSESTKAALSMVCNDTRFSPGKYFTVQWKNEFSPQLSTITLSENRFSDMRPLCSFPCCQCSQSLFTRTRNCWFVIQNIFHLTEIGWTKIGYFPGHCRSAPLQLTYIWISHGLSSLFL